MDLQRRWPAALAVASSALGLTDAHSTEETVTADSATQHMHDAAKGNINITMYATGLNGVNQPVNLLLKDAIWWSLGIIALIILVIRLGELTWSHLRLVSSMGLKGPEQTYWKYAQWSWMPSLKKHLIYAPIWKKRRHRDFKIGSVISMGTLPSRLQALLLLFYLGTNLAYCLILDYSNLNRWAFLAELRGRTGTLAAVNMVPLFILAGRNNPLIALLRIDFSAYNLLHRWMGRTVVFEALVHTLAWLIVQVAGGGWSTAFHRMRYDPFIASGTIATVGFTAIMILSVSPIRNAWYETFLNVHILLAFIAIVCTWVHCAAAELPGGLPQLPWVIAIVLLWCADRFARMLRMAYYNHSTRGWSEAEVEAMADDACRVTVHLPRYVDIKPGSHAYLRFLNLSPWESHPFSIARVVHNPLDDRLPTREKKDLLFRPNSERFRTSVSFIIGAQTGFTRKLYNRAMAHQEKEDKMYMKVLFEGPYAGHHSIDSYGHAVLFAGGTGITHALSYLAPIIEAKNQGTCATRRVTLVWIIRDYASLEWIRPWMDEILRLPGRKDILRIKLYVTRPKDPREIRSPSETVTVEATRPNVQTLLEKEVAEQMGAMHVSVCGPGTLSDSVAEAVRNVIGKNTSVTGEAPVISYHDAIFKW